MTYTSKEAVLPLLLDARGLVMRLSSSSSSSSSSEASALARLTWEDEQRGWCAREWNVGTDPLELKANLRLIFGGLGALPPLLGMNAMSKRVLETGKVGIHTSSGDEREGRLRH